MQARQARKARKDASTPSTQVRKHANMLSAWGRMHVNTESTRARQARKLAYSGDY